MQRFSSMSSEYISLVSTYIVYGRLSVKQVLAAVVEILVQKSQFTLFWDLVQSTSPTPTHPKIEIWTVSVSPVDTISFSHFIFKYWKKKFSRAWFQEVFRKFGGICHGWGLPTEKHGSLLQLQRHKSGCAKKWETEAPVIFECLDCVIQKHPWKPL